MASSEAFYSDTTPWTPPRNAYPTWDHLIRFYMTRIYSPATGITGAGTSSRCIKSSPDHVIHDCVMVWESGDG